MRWCVYFELIIVQKHKSTHHEEWNTELQVQ